MRGDNGTATGERLQHNVGAAFHVTWQGDQIGCRHPDSNIVECASGQHVNKARGVVGLNCTLDERPVWPFADQIHMQIGALGTQRCRCFDEFTKPFPRVHAPNVNDGLRGLVDAQFPPRLKAIANVENRKIATVDHCAGRLRRSAHGHSLPAQVAADRDQKIGFA